MEEEDGTISLEDFIVLVESRNAVIIEVEGVWVDETYILIKEAEVETEDDDSEE